MNPNDQPPTTMQRLTYAEIEAEYGVPIATSRGWMSKGLLTRAGTRPSDKGGRPRVLVADDDRLAARVEGYEPRGAEAGNAPAETPTLAQVEGDVFGGSVLVTYGPEISEEEIVRALRDGGSIFVERPSEPRPSWWGRLVQRFRDTFVNPFEAREVQA